jgi:hypothetical protein
MNTRAVQQTDDLFYQRHPELVDPGTGERRPLTMDASDRDLRREWMQMYRGADAADKAGFRACDVGGTVQPCPAAAAAPAAPAAAAPPPECKVEVRANKLSSLGYYHMFIVFTDENGKEYFLRGGPSGSGGGSAASSGELSGGSSRAGSDSTSGSGSNPSAASDSSRGGIGPYGDIVTKYGEYLPGTIDYDTGAPAVTVMNGVDACAKYAELTAQMDAITASHTRYNPLGPNSNSVVFTSLKNVGITPKTPDDVWAPGKDAEIDVPAPAAVSP